MVTFTDGSTIAQMGPPRMLVPIALGLSWPDRLADVDEPCDWGRVQTWDFAPLDDEAFPAVRLARSVGQAGGTYPAVYNAANEVCVDAFHARSIGFLDIVDTVARVVDAYPGPGSTPEDLSQAASDFQSAWRTGTTSSTIWRSHWSRFDDESSERSAS